MRRCLRDPTFSRFDTILECDRQTHTHRHTTTAYTALSIASRGKKQWRHVQAYLGNHYHAPPHLYLASDVTVTSRMSQYSSLIGRRHDQSNLLQTVVPCLTWIEFTRLIVTNTCRRYTADVDSDCFQFQSTELFLRSIIYMLQRYRFNTTTEANQSRPTVYVYSNGRSGLID